MGHFLVHPLGKVSVTSDRAVQPLLMIVSPNHPHTEPKADVSVPHRHVRRPNGRDQFGTEREVNLACGLSKFS